MSAVLSSARCRPSGTGIVIESLSGADELQALVPDWEALAAESAEPNPFYEHWMLLPALEAYGAAGAGGSGSEFRMLAIWQDGQLGALLPMWLERRYRGLPVSALRSWRHRNMLICTPLIRAKSAAACAAALLQSGLAAVLEFEWISAS